jgi:hypothetical protein
VVRRVLPPNDTTTAPAAEGGSNLLLLLVVVVSVVVVVVDCGAFNIHCEGGVNFAATISFSPVLSCLNCGDARSCHCDATSRRNNSASCLHTFNTEKSFLLIELLFKL